MSKTLTIAIMDAPYETETSTTQFRMIHSALSQGYNVNIFAYEGSTALTLKTQAPHPNPAHGTDVTQEQHPTTKDWVTAVFELAKQKNLKLDWINCGMCVDERGVADWVPGPRRGGPDGFLKQAQESDNTIVIPTKRNS